VLELPYNGFDPGNDQVDRLILKYIMDDPNEKEGDGDDSVRVDQETSLNWNFI